MKKLPLYILPFVLLLVNSCKKNSLPPDESPDGTPVFQFKGNVNGTNIDLIEAGKIGYYMYSSYYQDSNNVYVYKADLKQKGNTNIPGYALSVLINDFKVSQPNEEMKPDSGLFLGKHEFNDGDVPALTVNGLFAPLMQSFGAPYTWAFNDGTTTKTLTTQNSYFNYSFYNNRTYSVSCAVGNTNTPTHTNVFKIGNPLQANINVSKIDPVSSLHYSFTVSSTLAGSGYMWEFGDGNNTGAIPLTYPLTDHDYTITGQNYYTTKLTVTNGTNTCESYYQVPAYYPAIKPHANYTSTFTPVPNIKSLGAISILLTDPSGKVYSSNALSHGAGDSFEIVSVEDYKRNESWQPTKKLKVRFNCLVKNGNDILTISNGEAVIAVSYK